MSKVIMAEGHDRNEYADAVGFIRVKEKRDLLNSSRLVEFISLTDTEIVEHLSQGLRWDSGVVESLDRCHGLLLSRDYEEVESFDHRRLVVPLLRYRFDLHNLRVILRRRNNGGAYRFAPVPGTIPIKVLEIALIHARPLPLPQDLLDKMPPFMDGTVHRASEAFEVGQDAAWLNYAWQHAVENALPNVAYYLEAAVDFAVIKLAWRRAAGASGLFHAALHVGLPAFGLDAAIHKCHDRERIADIVAASRYGSALREGLARWRADGSWILMERDMDNHLLSRLSGTRYQALSPEPLFAYLVSREHDLRNLRLLHSFKALGYGEHTIKPFLRKTHV